MVELSIFEATRSCLNAGVYSKDYEGLGPAAQAAFCVGSEIFDGLQDCLIKEPIAPLELYQRAVDLADAIHPVILDARSASNGSACDTILPPTATKQNLMAYVCQDMKEEVTRRTIVRNELYPLVGAGLLHGAFLLLEGCCDALKAPEPVGEVMAKAAVRIILDLLWALLEVPYDSFDDELGEVPLLVLFLCERDRFGADAALQWPQMKLMPLAFASLRSLSAVAPRPQSLLDDANRMMTLVLKWYPQPRITPAVLEQAWVSRWRLMANPEASEWALLASLFSLPVGGVAWADLPEAALSFLLLTLSSGTKLPTRGPHARTRLAFERCSCTACEWRRKSREFFKDQRYPPSVQSPSHPSIASSQSPKPNSYHKACTDALTLIANHLPTAPNSAVGDLLRVAMCCLDISLAAKELPVASVGRILGSLASRDQASIDADVYSGAAYLVLSIVYAHEGSYETLGPIQSELAKLSSSFVTHLEALPKGRERYVLPLGGIALAESMTAACLSRSDTSQHPPAGSPSPQLFLPSYSTVLAVVAEEMEIRDDNRIAPVTGVYAPNLTSAFCCLLSLLTGRTLQNALALSHVKPSPDVGLLRLHSGFLEAKASELRSNLDLRTASNACDEDQDLGDSIVSERRAELALAMTKTCTLQALILEDSKRMIESTVGVVKK